MPWLGIEPGSLASNLESTCLYHWANACLVLWNWNETVLNNFAPWDSNSRAKNIIFFVWISGKVASALVRRYSPCNFQKSHTSNINELWVHESIANNILNTMVVVFSPNLTDLGKPQTGSENPNHGNSCFRPWKCN